MKYFSYYSTLVSFWLNKLNVMSRLYSGFCTITTMGSNPGAGEWKVLFGVMQLLHSCVCLLKKP